jgi:hypothetical protein
MGQEGKMEMIIATIGAITGVAGLIISVFVVRWQAKIQAKSDRMAFLSNVIFNSTIDRASRQPFYDEYIAKNGNGPVVEFWLREGQKEQAAISK